MFLPKIYSLRADLLLLKTSAEVIFLRSETENYVVAGKLYFMLLPLVDGVRSDEEIVKELSPIFKPEDVYYGFLKLLEKGYIAENVDKIRCKEKENIPTKIKCLNRSEVLFGQFRISGDNLDTNLILNELQIQNHEYELRKSLSVQIVLCQDYLDPDVSIEVEVALKNGYVCYPVKISGMLAWFGPLIIPGQKPCFKCLLYQIKRNRPLDTYLFRLGYTYKEISPL